MCLKALCPVVSEEEQLQLKPEDLPLWALKVPFETIRSLSNINVFHSEDCRLNLEGRLNLMGFLLLSD